LRHLGGLSGTQRVLAGHGAGQAGQLDHHLGGQVELGELTGAAQRRPFGGGEADDSGQVGGDAGDALGTVGDRAEPLLEGQLGQASFVLLGRLLLVGAPEERGVLVPGTQHRFVAGAHQFDVARAVGDGDEVRQQLAVLATDRQIALVLTHDRGQDLTRQLEVLGGERTKDRVRLLDQVGDLVEQGALALEVDGAADLGDQLGGAGDDLLRRTSPSSTMSWPARKSA